MQNLPVNMRNIKNLTINILLVNISIALALLVMELATRAMYNDHYINWMEFRKSRPEPYKNAEYFSKKFLEEQFSHSKWINPPGTRIIYPENFKGEYFNIENNRRFTTDTPKKYTNHIYLYGGSTVFCSEVPDKHTVASYLQRYVNIDFPDKYCVVNCGVTSVNTLQQLEKLMVTKIDSGDIVCFYGGVNDGLLFTTGRVNGWIMGEKYIEYSRKFNLLQKIRYKIHLELSNYSYFVRIFLDPYSYQVPVPLQNPENIKNLQNKLFQSYTNTISSADSICRKHNAVFYNFLQPNLVTRANNTPYETDLLKHKYLIANANILALKYSYEMLVKANEQLVNSGITSTDLTSIFNYTNDNYYLDYCHVTEKANEIIASKIFKVIKE
jgi:lysophospholipase L1-like esterase